MKTLIRLHQVLLVLAILSGCYEPELRDCTVTCEGATDCADGQTCSAGLCAANGVACVEHVIVHVTVEGNGAVELGGTDSCDRDCMISVVKGQVTAVATPANDQHPFDKWASTTCKDKPATCTFTASSPTTIQAKFR